jgi:hypothetical protein
LRLAALTLFLSACTFEWNGQSSPFPLSGAEPSVGSYDKLNASLAGRASLLTGLDGTPWAAFCEFWNAGGGNNAGACKKEHLVELGGMRREEFIEADSFALHNTEVYAIHDVNDSHDTVTLHYPGDAITNDNTFIVPAGSGTITVAAANADSFTYSVVDSTTMQPSFVWFNRADGAGPRGEASTIPALTRILADGSAVVTADTSGILTVYGDDHEQSFVLNGPVATQDFALIDDIHRAVITLCAGICSTTLADSSLTVLSDAMPDPTTISIHNDQLYYVDDGSLWQVPLDASKPPSIAAQTAARLLSVGPQNQLLYSHDDALKYSGGAGDGYIGATQVMERGRVIRWSTDDERIFYLEHAATLGTYGDLTSFVQPNGPATTLSINAHSYAELPDHRVLAIEDAVYRGSWNRLVVIDEAAGTKHWVAPSVAEFSLTPDGSTVVADVVSGASGYDIYRIPIGSN